MLAAAAEISQREFEETVNLQPTSKTWANAQAFASMNNSYLSRYGVSAVVTGITVDEGDVRFWRRYQRLWGGSFRVWCRKICN